MFSVNEIEIPRQNLATGWRSPRPILCPLPKGQGLHPRATMKIFDFGFAGFEQRKAQRKKARGSERRGDE